VIIPLFVEMRIHQVVPNAANFNKLPAVEATIVIILLDVLLAFR
jgi:hypothetical protein